MEVLDFLRFKKLIKILKKKRFQYKRSRFPIWYSRDNNFVWFDKNTPHYVNLGSTGSGKSVTAFIPTCTFIANAKIKRSVFITDPKGEIFQTTSKCLKIMVITFLLLILGS
jgi:type IV secretory pathway TraG/TraD family ATPase VirD4